MSDTELDGFVEADFNDLMGDGFDDEHGNETREVTELLPELIKPEDIHCACMGGGCSKGIDKSCKCYGNGAGCASTCTCTNCKNYLNILSSFFGKEGVRAGPCFRQWLDKSAKSRQPIDLESHVSQEELRSKLFGIKPGDVNVKPTHDLFRSAFYDQNLFQLGQDWFKPGVTEEERKSLLKVLFISAFGEDPAKHFKPWFYSLCRESWQEEACTRHCEICEECNDWMEWHCTTCNVCTFGQSRPCGRCGGVSQTYATMRYLGH